MKTTDYFSLHKNNFDFAEFLRLAFKEDVGDGDHTSLSTIPAKQKGKMQLLIKEEGILAGVEVAQKIFSLENKKNEKIGKNWKNARNMKKEERKRMRKVKKKN